MAVADRIVARAAQVRLRPLLLSVVAAPFALLGWLAFWLTLSARSAGRRAASGLRLLVAAVLVGWDTARKRHAG